MKKLHALLLVALVVALSACVPTAEWLRDQLDTGAGATLDFVEGGVAFDPGPAVAFDVHVSLRGEGLALLEGAPEACEVTPDARYIDCPFVEVREVLVIPVTGKGVLGSAKYVRQPGSLAWEWAYTPVQ